MQKSAGRKVEPAAGLPGGKNSPPELSEDNLGEKVSIYFRVPGDPEHPFSEVVGLLQQIDRSGGSPVYRVTRRSGEVVLVPKSDVVKLKLVPPAVGPVRPPKTWSGR